MMLSQSLKLLSVMAVNRLDEDAHHVEKTLSTALVDSPDTANIANIANTDKSITKYDPLASSTWEKVVFFYSLMFFI